MGRLIRMGVWLALPVVLLGTWGYLSEKEVGVAATKGTGTIIGIVKFVGTPPSREKIPVVLDIEYCGEERISQALIVGPNRGIQHAVVSLVGMESSPKKGAKITHLDQVDCDFVPRVVIAPVGSPIIILNTDDFLHSFHTRSTKNPPLNKAQPSMRKVLKEKFRHPEIIEVSCDLHRWMKAWIVVAEHPYYIVTDDTGVFTLTDVPAGTYQLKVWHETLGETTKDVIVKPEAETKVTFELTKKEG
ncbi:MAG: carboxypeptidase regulatory-like domain-containing protein [Candidatus Binatia bacterium]